VELLGEAALDRTPGRRLGARSLASSRDVALPRAGWEHVRTRAAGNGRSYTWAVAPVAILPLLYSLSAGRAWRCSSAATRTAGHLAQLSERWGYRVVRGSSQRGGGGGLLGLVRHLRDSASRPHADGPRGPAEHGEARRARGGPARRRSRDRGGRASISAWWIRSWDRFCLPKPFATSTSSTVHRSPWQPGRMVASGYRRRGTRAGPPSHVRRKGEGEGRASRTLDVAGRPAASLTRLRWSRSRCPTVRRCGCRAAGLTWAAAYATSAPAGRGGGNPRWVYGKTPLAAWIARHLTPGAAVRRHSVARLRADEPLVHRRLVRGRCRGIGTGLPVRRRPARGADVLVLDDCVQLLAVGARPEHRGRDAESWPARRAAAGRTVAGRMGCAGASGRHRGDSKHATADAATGWRAGWKRGKGSGAYAAV